jgi:hypothetical protein
MQAEDQAILDAYVAQHLPQATEAEPAEATPDADQSAGAGAGEQDAGGQP